MTPCTEWFHLEGYPPAFEYNHLEFGHATTLRPKPKTPEHARPWGHGIWRRYHAWLNDDVPPMVVHYGPDDLNEA